MFNIYILTFYLKSLWHTVKQSIFQSIVLCKKSRVEDAWLDKTFVSRVISKTPYSHFRTHSISIVEKYKQVIRNYKWKEMSF